MKYIVGLLVLPMFPIALAAVLFDVAKASVESYLLEKLKEK